MHLTHSQFCFLPSIQIHLVSPTFFFYIISLGKDLIAAPHHTPHPSSPTYPTLLSPIFLLVFEISLPYQQCIIDVTPQFYFKSCRDVPLAPKLIPPSVPQFINSYPLLVFSLSLCLSVRQFMLVLLIV